MSQPASGYVGAVDTVPPDLGLLGVGSIGAGTQQAANLCLSMCQSIQEKRAVGNRLVPRNTDFSLQGP